MIYRQQLDDISFNLSKIDVFGRRMKKAALSKCFCAEFERQPFSKRKKVGIFLKGIYFLNLCALLFGMGYINYNQNRGVYYSDSLSVTYGEQIWNAAIITGSFGLMLPLFDIALTNYIAICLQNICLPLIIFINYHYRG